MVQVLHGRATTAEAVRRAILHRQESLRARAKRSGIKQKTVAKGKKRRSVADLPTGPREARSTVLGPVRSFVYGGPDGFEGEPHGATEDPVLREALLDRLPGGVDAKSAFDGGGRIGQLKKALAERALKAERDHPLLSEGSSGNSRNGYGKKRF